MSSVTKPIAASNTSPVTSTRSGSTSARQISSSYGAVSELYAQTGVRSEDEPRDFDDFNNHSGQRNPSHDQPQTLKLHGTSRTFAMLFEAQQDEYSDAADDRYIDANGFETSGNKPAFQAYMAKATSTYETSSRAVNGEWKSRGGSLNVAL